MADENSPLLLPDNETSPSLPITHQYKELDEFQRWLKWTCFNQSNPLTASFSWLVFLVLTVIVPAVAHFFLSEGHNRPHDAVAQLSLSAVAALSFISMSRLVRKLGLQKFLLFDELCQVSQRVKEDYSKQFYRSLKLLLILVLPCFTLETAYKIWWYVSGKRPSHIHLLIIFVACFFELLSWLYRTISFFLVCIVFQLICHLQILRLRDFAHFFQVDSDIKFVLREHLRIRRHLWIISHRFRMFIVCALAFITVSLFAVLLLTTRSIPDDTMGNTGQLVVCSLSLLAGLVILLHSATKITHKAQAITSLAAKWHVCATVDPFNEVAEGSDHLEDELEIGDDEEYVRFIEGLPNSEDLHQRRQALVSYLENNEAGIMIHGFMLDRSLLNTIISFELNLVLWVLGKTIAIS